MVERLIEIVLGAALAAGTLLDVFGTVVVPGRVTYGLRIPALLRWSALPVWRRMLRLLGHRRRTVTSSFAGALLFGLFAVWVLLLMCGLSLMALGLRESFSPPLPGYPAAMFQIGSAMMTLGLNNVGATGWSRAVVVAAGVCGLQVVTLTLTYIVQLQMALQGRDPQVLRLSSSAGGPPSGLGLLVTMKSLDLEHELGRLFEQWCEWSSVLRQTNRAHPVLVYFRSSDPHTDWVTALGAMLDASALVMAVQEKGPKGHAELFYRNGTAAVRDITAMLGLAHCPPQPIETEDVAEAIRRIEATGYAARPLGAAAPDLRRLREPYSGGILALAHHFDIDAPILAP